MEKEFLRLIEDVTSSDVFASMKNYKHHVNSNVYDHSVKVAYLCYLHHKRFKMKAPISELVRAALLHDFFLYDCHSGSIRGIRHLLLHPRRALENARLHFGNITEREADAIRSHMFPISARLPRSSIAWLVCFYDKVAAISDILHRRKCKAK